MRCAVKISAIILFVVMMLPDRVFAGLGSRKWCECFSKSECYELAASFEPGDRQSASMSRLLGELIRPAGDPVNMETVYESEYLVQYKGRSAETALLIRKLLFEKDKHSNLAGRILEREFVPALAIAFYSDMLDEKKPVPEKALKKLVQLRKKYPKNTDLARFHFRYLLDRKNYRKIDELLEGIDFGNLHGKSGSGFLIEAARYRYLQGSKCAAALLLRKALETDQSNEMLRRYLSLLNVYCSNRD